MVDVLKSRMLFGVVMPSTNTVVQPEYDSMRPKGVANDLSRINNLNEDRPCHDIGGSRRDTLNSHDATPALRQRSPRRAEPTRGRVAV